MSALNRFHRINLALALSSSVFVASSLVGCKHRTKMPEGPGTEFKSEDGTESITIHRYESPTTTESRRLEVQIQPSENRPILQGKLPLTYLVDSDMTLSVTDATGNMIASAEAKSGSILTVSARGVYLGRKKLGNVKDTAGIFSIYYIPPPDFIQETNQVPRDGHPSQ